ncbi:MAG: DUF3440 domain-containing protein [Synergistota bacterium]|nr:DUF3440 domain-containing protein [Synergistota bacterium]
MKTYLDINVLEAAKRRMDYIFDEFDRVCVSFSGGKDSTVLLHLAINEARKRGRLPVEVLFIDWEAQYQATIDHVYEMLSDPGTTKAYWICLPLSTDNGSSMHEPLWTAWDKDKRDLWVRAFPDHPGVIKDYDALPFYRYGMFFEEFVPEFQEWLAGDDSLACLVGVRTDESLNRFRAIRKERPTRRKGLAWTRELKGNSCACYPIYDWGVTDIWKYIGENNVSYNKIYDRMYWLGQSVHEMRINEPYGPEARRGLAKHHPLEPETWSKIVERVGGANFGKISGLTALFARGNKIIRPDSFRTWREYAYFLLSTYPPATRDHYLRRINVLRKWWWDNRQEELLGAGVPEGDIYDDHEHPKKESWRTVCRVLLENDYFCTKLCFGVNKKEFEKLEALKEKYRDL